MRAATFLGLLVPAALGAGMGVALISCHKQPPPQAQLRARAASAAQGIKLEAYDPVIPRAPAPGPKLETATPHPAAEAANASPSAEDAEAPVETLPPLHRPAPNAYAQAQTHEPAEPGGAGRYIDAPAYGAYRPGDQRAADVAEPQGFRLNVRICRAAARQSDPLAQTPECQGMLEAARVQQDACARAFEAGNDDVVLSPACRQAAMGR